MKRMKFLIPMILSIIMLLSGCAPPISGDSFETLDIFHKSATFTYDRIEDENSVEIEYAINVEGDKVSTESVIVFDYGEVVSESVFNKKTLKPSYAHKGNSYNLDPSKNWDIYAEYGENSVEMRAETSSETEMKSLDLPEYYLDNEALLFTIGALTLEEGYKKDINISIIDAGEAVAFRVANLGTETVTVPYGTVECIKVEVRYTGLVLGRKPRMYIWYSDDENRYPVKYENRGIYLELKSVK